MGSLATRVAISASRGAVRSVLNPMRESQRREILDDTMYMFNVRKGHAPITILRTWGAVTIQPCSDDKEYSVTPVHGRIEILDMGDDKGIEATTTAHEVADDIYNFINGDCPELTARPDIKVFNGVFYGKNETPSERELKKYQEMFKNYDLALISEARLFWSNPETRKNISPAMRKAGDRQGIRGEEWLSVFEETQTCPACGDRISTGVAVCKSCGAVVDEAKARKFFPERFAKTA